MPPSRIPPKGPFTDTQCKNRLIVNCNALQTGKACIRSNSSRRQILAFEVPARGAVDIASTILHEQDFAHHVIEHQLSDLERDAVVAAYNHATYLSDWAALPNMGNP